MDVKEAYDLWSIQHDNNHNKTRDLEAEAKKRTLSEIHFSHCLELGCGTGKNTEWLLIRTKCITAVDFSEGMLLKAKEKFSSRSEEITFIQGDITLPWRFGKAVLIIV